MEKDVIKLFGTMFSQAPMFLDMKDWVTVEIYDTATQFFLFWDIKTPIYWRLSEELRQVINKIVKENWFWAITKDTVLLEDITQFRRIFWNHPEVWIMMQAIVDKHELDSNVELLNLFFNEMIRLSVYNDEKLVNLREFRIYIAKKSIAMRWDITNNLKHDLFHFLDFGRFNTSDYVRKKADEVLNKICIMIDNGEVPDLRNMKTYNDREEIPMVVVDMIERLVLMNYNDKPDPKTVKEINRFVEKMDLWLLKEYFGFFPKWRQKYALIMESRENLAANCRRSWKSRLMTYIATRQVFLPWQMILYMLPTKEDYSEQPFFYIEQMLENVKKLGAELPWFQFNAKQFRVVNKTMKSKIIFLSAVWSSKGKSFSANLGIMDESWYIDNWNTYDQMANSTSDTKWRMWAVSTINVDIPINWFFFKKVSLDWMDDSRVFSVDIYQNPFMSKEEKERIERKYKNKNKDVWAADWMAIFIWWENSFDISNFFKIDFTYDVMTFKGCVFNVARKLDEYNRFILTYDPAKTLDRAGIAVIWLKWHKAEAVMTWYIDIKNYFLQWEVILDIISYVSTIKPCELGVDLGKAWEAAFDWFESKRLSPYGILSTWWSTINKQTYRRWNVPEKIMEKNLHSLMAAKVITWFSRLDNIRNEFETYWLSKERSSKVNHHHDVLSALMMATMIRYERWFIKIEGKNVEKKREAVVVDQHWRPIKSLRKWQFSWSTMWKFMH